MPVPEIVRTLEEDERFPSLTWREQQHLRAKAWGRALRDNPQFQALDPQERQALYMSRVNAVPRFEDPSMQATVEDLVRRFSSEDPREKERAFEDIGRVMAGSAHFMYKGQAVLHSRIDPDDPPLSFGSRLDWTKATDYLMSIVDQEEGFASRARVGMAIATVGGPITEIAAGLTVIPSLPGIAAARAATFGRMAAQAAKATGPGGRFLWGQVAPNVARAIGSGAIGATFSVAEEVIHTDTNTAKQVLLNAGRRGLEWAVGDIAGFALLSGVVLPAVRGGVNVFSNALARGGWTGTTMRTAIGDFAEGMKRALSAVDIPEHIIARLPEESRKALRRYERAARILSNPERVHPGSFESLELGAQAVNREAVRAGSIIEIRNPLNPKSRPEKFESIDDAFDHIENLWRQQKGPLPATETAIEEAPRGVRVTRVLKGGESEVNATADEILARTINPSDGQLVKENVQTFIKVFTRQLGLGDAAAQRVRQVSTERYFSKTADELANQATIEIPRTLPTPARAERFANQLVEQVLAKSPSASKSISELRAEARKIVRAIPKTIEQKRIHSPVWVRQMWRKLTGNDLVDRPGSGVGVQERGSRGQFGQSFFDVNEAGRAIFARTIDEDTARIWLSDQFGFKLNKVDTDDGIKFEVRTRQGERLGPQYNRLADIWEHSPELRPNYPIETAGTFHFVETDRVGGIELVDQTPVGNIQDTLRYMSQFQDYRARGAETVVRVGDGSRVTFNRKQEIYRVEIPETGHVREFRSQKLAREYLQSGWKEWDDILDVAVQKGYHVVPFRGSLLVYPHGGGAPRLADNINDLRAIMRDTPTPRTGPEMSRVAGDALDQEELLTERIAEPNLLVTTGDDIVDDLPSGQREESLATHGINFAAPVDVFFRRTSRELDVPELLDNFENVQAALRTGQGQANFAGATVENVFLDGGRRMPGRRRRLLGDVFVMSVEPDDWARIATEKFGETLSENELRTLRNYRDMLVNDVTGVAARFGHDGIRFYQTLGYLRKWVRDNPRRLYFDGETMQFLKDALPSLPNDIRQWAQGARWTDLIQYVYKRDLLELGVGHLSGLIKRATVGPAVNAAEEWIKSVQVVRGRVQQGVSPGNVSARLVEQAENLTDLAIEKFHLYLRDVMHTPRGYGEKWLRQVSLKMSRAMSDFFSKRPLFRKWGLDDRVLTTDILSSAMAISSGALMGFRPWIAIRNMFQVMTTLAPRVGNDAVLEGMRRMGQRGDEIVEKMLVRGIIGNNIPAYGFDVDSLRASIVNKGMAAFKNSDVWTRGVGYATAEWLLEDSWGRFTKGVLGTGEEAVDRFMNLSRLRVAPPEVRDQTFRLLKAGKFDDALDVYANNLIFESFFPYQRALDPLAFKGVVGRLFGQFGHYPVYFAANIFRQMARGTWADRAMFFGQWLGNSGAIYAGLAAIGINGGYNFLPWNQVGFTGGPLFDLGVTLLRTGAPGIEGRLARREVIRRHPFLFAPGSYYGRSLLKMVEALDEGDYQRAALNFLSAPVLPEHARGLFD